jgi:hypothetical protein
MFLDGSYETGSFGTGFADPLYTGVPGSTAAGISPLYAAKVVGIELPNNTKILAVTARAFFLFFFFIDLNKLISLPISPYIDEMWSN